MGYQGKGLGVETPHRASYGAPGLYPMPGKLKFSWRLFERW